MAIAWSYAAALEIGIPPEIVFHPDGYRGASESMLQTSPRTVSRSADAAMGRDDP